MPLDDWREGFWHYHRVRGSSPYLLLLQLVGKHVVGDKAKGAARAVFLPLARFYQCGAALFAVFGPWTLQGAASRPFRLTLQVISNGVVPTVL